MLLFIEGVRVGERAIDVRGGSAAIVTVVCDVEIVQLHFFALPPAKSIADFDLVGTRKRKREMKRERKRKSTGTEMLHPTKSKSAIDKDHQTLKRSGSFCGAALHRRYLMVSASAQVRVRPERGPPHLV